MRKNIVNVERYYQPYIKDCFLNAVSSLLLFKKLDPDLIFTEYLSFAYEPDTGFCGVNYISKPLSIKEFSTKEANCAFEFCRIILRRDRKQETGKTDPPKLGININFEKDPALALDLIKQRIDAGEPAVIGVDLFYMPYHRAFNREHGLHYIIVTGYDDEEGIVSVSDRYPLTNCDFEGSISYADLERGRSSDFPQSNPLMGDFTRPVMNRWVEIDIPAYYEISGTQVKEVINKSCNRMKGREKPLPCHYGLPALAVFKENILNKRDKLNEVNTFLFRKYYNETCKIIARSRRHFQVFLSSRPVFTNRPRYAEMESALTNSSRSWDIFANLCYKLAASKRMDIIDSIALQLDVIAGFEENICNMLAGLV